MNKPSKYDTTATIDYSQYAAEHKEELLQSAVDAINPDAMGMERSQALTLAGAMKNCGFSRDDFAEVMRRSSADKGTFAAQWDKFSGSGQHGEAGEGTIFDYAKQSGWKWPAPDADADNSKTMVVKKKEASKLTVWKDDFKFVCILDDKAYSEKPTQEEAMAIRSREKSPTPAPEPISPVEFARAVTSGRTVTPTVYSKEQVGVNDKGRPKYKYRAIEQQLFIVDIDNETKARDENGKVLKDENGKEIKKCIDKPLTVEAALEICDEINIKPMLVYETFSSKYHRSDPEQPYKKFRLCFVTDEPITVQEYGERGLSKIREYLIGLFGEAADQSTTDTARLIYGTDERNSATLRKHIIRSKMLIERIEQAEKEEPDIADTSEKVLTPTEEVDAFIDLIQTRQYEPVATGITDVDKLLKGGFIRQQNVFLTAAPGMGKSTLCQQIAESMARQGHKVIYYNLEMSKEQMIARSLSRIGVNDLSAIQILQAYDQPADVLEKIKEAAEAYKIRYKDNLEYNPQYYDEDDKRYYSCNADLDSIILSMEQSAEKSRKAEQAAPIVVIDYLHLLRGSRKEDAADTLKRAVEVFKDYAVKYNTIVLIISANNRSANRSGKASMDTARDTSAIEYSGDIMLSLNYDLSDRANGETVEEIRDKIREYREKGEDIPLQYRLYSLCITKSRFGESDQRAVLEFDGKHSKFKQLERAAAFKRAGGNKSDEPTPAVIKARTARDNKRADYVKAFNYVKSMDFDGEVTTQALADYLGVSQATVKRNIADLFPEYFKLDGVAQNVESHVVSLATDPEYKEATDENIPFMDEQQTV